MLQYEEDSEDTALEWLRSVSTGLSRRQCHGLVDGYQVGVRVWAACENDSDYNVRVYLNRGREPLPLCFVSASSTAPEDEALLAMLNTLRLGGHVSPSNGWSPSFSTAVFTYAHGEPSWTLTIKKSDAFVDAERIVSGTITADKISAGHITLAKVSNGTSVFRFRTDTNPTQPE